MVSNLCLILTLFFSINFARAELLYLAVGNKIEVKRINPETGELSDFQAVEHPRLSHFTFSKNKQFLYAQAVMRSNPKQPSIVTYKVEADGKLIFVNNAPIGIGTTDLKTDYTDSFIVGSSYGKGVVHIWQLEEGIYKGKLVQEIALEKKAHSNRFSPDNKLLMVPATEPNKVFQLAFDKQSGKAKRLKDANGPSSGASQPRHLIFHPQLDVAYTTLERKTPGVGVWKRDSETGELTLIENIQSSNDVEARITTADLHLSPDNKFLYISSRDNSKELDAIIAYSVDSKTGRLTFVESFPCEHIPRSFCISKSGDFLYVAGKRVHLLGVYKRNKDTGHLTKVTQYKTGKGPAWVETLKVPIK